MIASTEERQLARTETVLPDVKFAVEAMKLFQQMKKDLLEDDDTVTIGKKEYIKRSGLRKIALAFNLSVEVMETERERTGDDWSVRVKARSTTPSGRFCEDVGVCDSDEVRKGGMNPTLHNVESKATTRAINRAIADLVGGGVVSADELPEGDPGGNGPPPAKGAAQKAYPPQVKMIVDFIGKSQVNANYVSAFLGDVGAKNPQDLTAEQATALIDSLQKGVKA